MVGELSAAVGAIDDGDLCPSEQIGRTLDLVRCSGVSGEAQSKTVTSQRAAAGHSFQPRALRKFCGNHFALIQGHVQTWVPVGLVARPSEESLSRIRHSGEMNGN